MNYLASPPLCVAYALVGTMDIDIAGEPLGQDEQRRGRLPARHLAVRAGDRQDDRRGGARGHVPQELRRGVRRRRALERPRGARGRALRLGRAARPTCACRRTSRTCPPSPPPVSEHRRRARARAARRQRHDRPHLAGRRDQARRPGRRLPAGAGVSAARLQLLRLAPRQPRGDDARHVRQHPPAQPARAAAPRAASRATSPDGSPSRCRSTTRRCATARRASTLVVLAGKEYGSGSSRDWAAKGTKLLGVRAVIAQSFERIHRSNLVGMGVLPLQFPDGESAAVAGADRRGGVLDRRHRRGGRRRRRAAGGAQTVHVRAAARRRRAGRASTRACASTRRARPSTSATAASCSTSCACCSPR